MRVTIVDDDRADEYVVITEGVSEIPGERVYGRVERTTSVEWIVDFLRRNDRQGNRFLPNAARKALLEAGAADEDIDWALSRFEPELVRS